MNINQEQIEKASSKLLDLIDELEFARDCMTMSQFEEAFDQLETQSGSVLTILKIMNPDYNEN